MGRWQIPIGWQWAKAPDVALIVGGGTPSTKNSANFAEKDIPWLTPADLSGYQEEYVSRGKRDLSKEGYRDSGAHLMPKDAVLFTSRAPIGYCVLATNEISTNQGFKSLVLKGGINPKYIRHYLLTSKKYAESLASGSTFKELSGHRMASLEIPIPPLEEQKRIVARIEELQAHSRPSREALEVIPDLLDQLRQSILADAFRGFLTKEWREKNPNIEPAKELLKRIRADRRKRWEEAELEKLKAKNLSADKLKEAFTNRRKQYKEPTQTDTDDLPELPQRWCWANIEELSDRLQYGSSLKSSKDGQIPVIRMGNLQNGEIDWSDLVYTSGKAEIKKYALSPDTVLFNRTNSPELVGKTSIYRGEREAIFAGYLIRINHVPQIIPQYLNLMLNSPFIRQLCSSVKSDAVSQSNINASKLAYFTIPLCSQKEQEVIVALAENAISRVNKVKNWIASLFDALSNLDQSILSKAFRGELVPQDPNDEHASVLLERIRATQAAQHTKVKRTIMERKPLMEKMTKESLKETILLRPEESFSFDELRNSVPADYETLKDALFSLLDEVEPSLKQIFDKETQSIRLVRVKS